MKKRDTKMFIEDASKIHNNTYNYSKTVFTRNRDKVTIICPKHGEFLQEANSHLKGHGCRLCQAERATKPDDLKFDRKSYMDDYNRSYREVNKEKLRQYDKDRFLKKRKSRLDSYYKHRDDPLFRARRNLSKRLYKCLKSINGSKPKTMSILGCSISELKIYIESKFQEGMTWDNYGMWHIDHIKPCALFDLTKEEQVNECFHFSNLQPLWATDNCSKGARFF